MTIVEGQIESLKKLKEKLNRSGITRFNSIAEINTFIKNYRSERNEIPKIIDNSFNDKIKILQSALVERQKTYDDLKAHISNEINHYIKNVEEDLNQVIKKADKKIINKILLFLKIRALKNKKSKLENDFEKTLIKKTRIARHAAINSKSKLDEHIENKEKIISEQCMHRYNEIDHLKKVVDDLYTLIAGAIGESTVVKELQKLSDNYILINDYSRKFNPPIYNRKENDQILSI